MQCRSRTLDATIERFRKLAGESIWQWSVGKRTSDVEVPEHVVALVTRVCDLAGSRSLIDDARVELASAGVIQAVQQRNDGVIFEWLMSVLSLQGISDAVALGYIEDHERISARSVERALAKGPSCPKLRAYHRFYDCGFRKWEDRCAEPNHKPNCPLPRHDLRNGRLNQTAYSLWLFMRDVENFVSWVDQQLRPTLADRIGSPGYLTGPVVGPMSHIYGVSAKTLNLAMATLLLAGDAERPDWIRAGADMIAVDSLVHNWFCRTGILRRLGMEHAFGEACYRQTGCAAVIRSVARRIDARRYNRGYPKDFPRFVQFALWSFCATDEQNICNGRRINDRKGCVNKDCLIFEDCDRLILSPALIGNPGLDR